jgi:hypothetical protein
MHGQNHIKLHNILLKLFSSKLSREKKLNKHFSLVRKKKVGLPQQAEVAQGVPGRLRPRIILTFGTTGVVGRQPCAPAVFTPGEIPGTHF